jgi:HAE1 family hydrophobic/amphiphilic exporter-1
MAQGARRRGRENVEIPGGAVEQGKGQLLLRTMGRIDAAEEFNNIVVATKNGTPIRLSDLGYAEDSFERPTSSVWFGDKPAVLLDVRRAMGENTVAVIEGVRARLQTIERSVPKSVRLTIVRDDSKFIYASVKSLEEHLIFGSLFAGDRRAVLHPQHARGDHRVARHPGVDHLVVHADAADGVHAEQHDAARHHSRRRHRDRRCDRRAGEHLPLHRREGRDAVRGGDSGTREVALAVMATTLSLVVIFLPMAFMTGYARRFINPFGLTMAFSILVSMLVSFTLTPMLSSRFLKLADGVRDHKTKESGFFHWIDTWYTRQVRWALDHHAGHPGHLRGHLSADVPAESPRRTRVRAQRGHGRVDGSPRRA